MRHKKRISAAQKAVLALAAVFVIVLLGSCHRPDQPRLRPGAFFGSPTGIYFPDPNDLGKHNFESPRGEKNGMIYTRRGGFIDLGHLREAADRTYYLTRLIYKNLMDEQTELAFRVVEPSVYRLSVRYPPEWNDLSKKEKENIAHETAVQIARYTAHNSLIWHEILTWFGFASSGLFSENISAFSWEDPYSDLLGVTLAAEVLREEQPYEQTLTRRIDETLRVLEAQPPEVARRAADRIDGKWYSGGFYFFVNMKKRNFDVGLDGRPLIPWLAPDICPDAQPYPLLAPTLKSPTAWGFTVEIELYPVELEKRKIYAILNRDMDLPLYPATHFPVLLEDIRRQAENHP